MFRKAPKPAEDNKDYKIEVSLSPLKFCVHIAHPTLCNGIEAFSSQKIDGFNFEIVSHNQVIISISPPLNFAQSDARFREALGFLNRFKLTTLELDQILNQYNKFLEDHKLESDLVAKVCKNYGYAYTSHNEY